MMTRLLYGYLIAFTVLIIIVHFMGSAGSKILHISRYTHLVLLVVSIILFIGLIYREVWAYRMGIIFYTWRLIVSPFWAYREYAGEQEIDPFFFLDWFMIFAALIILLFYKKIIVKITPASLLKSSKKIQIMSI